MLKQIMSKIKKADYLQRLETANTKNKVIKLIVSVLRILFLVYVGYVIFYPLMYMISSSFRTGSSYYDPTITWITSQVTLDNFKIAIDALDYFPSLFNTLVYEILAAIIQLFSCAVAAYGFARFNFKEKKIMLAILFVTILLPIQATLLPSFVNYSHMDFLGILGSVYKWFGVDLRPNLINTPFVFYLPALFGVGLRSGIIIYIYIQFFKGLPHELEEAAWIDGSGPVRTFLSIALPSSTVVIFTNLIFSVIWHWNDFYQAAMYLKDRAHFTLAVQLGVITDTLQESRFYWNSGTPATVSIVMAACVLYVLPMLILYMCVQTRFVKSIDRVGITG